MNINPEDLTVLDNEMIWDKHVPAFREMISYVQKIINFRSFRENIAPNSKPEFTLDIRIIGPLSTVGYKCRDPLLRCETIFLLAAASRQEGVWNSIMASRVCQRIMEIEEAELERVICAEDVPSWARVSEVDFEFDHQRRVHVRYRREGHPH